MKSFIAVIITILAGVLHSQTLQSQKLIIAISPDWNTNSGVLYLFDKTDGAWKQHGIPRNVHFGEQGMGWGKGLHGDRTGMYVKKEGDKRSPAGIFSIGALFGIGSTPPSGVRYPYARITSTSLCIDDPGSDHYGTIIEEASRSQDWKSAERLHDVRPDYTYILVIEHNKERIQRLGSCIFFHINNIPTVGCTSMDEDSMISMLQWLDPDKTTFVVQLPETEYTLLQTSWNLPVIQR
jgi:D-alanyl-D-alanine dipeptidase